MSASAPRLLGSRCEPCGAVSFPGAEACQRCGSVLTVQFALSLVGRVWSHTVQRVPPKSPPYVPTSEPFEPFAVGYVELEDGVKVEAVLDCADFEDLYDAEVRLVSSVPVPRFAATPPRGWTGPAAEPNDQMTRDQTGTRP